MDMPSFPFIHKDNEGNVGMKALCGYCHSSNMECIMSDSGQPICEKCNNAMCR